MRKQMMKGWLVVLTAGFMCAVALATPAIDSAIVHERIWNDASYSTLTYGNLYPSSLWIKDEGLDGAGWANRHNFRLSENGGISDAVFMNNDGFEFYADVTITGTANVEGGLNLSPWWSQDVDGVFMLNTETGEISSWGGRLPFYSFTNEYGLTYAKDTTARLGIVYNPNELSETDPGTIIYSYEIDGTTYTSPELGFDMGNESEGPTYGLWGILNDARVGGWFMPKVDASTPGNWGQIDFNNMVFVPEPAALVLLGLAGLVTLRRR